MRETTKGEKVHGVTTKGEQVQEGDGKELKSTGGRQQRIKNQRRTATKGKVQEGGDKGRIYKLWLSS